MSPWEQIGCSQFASLSTFRRSGEAVPTPVWVAVEGDDLVVTSERSTGKVKRLRNDPRVTLVPCSRFGDIERDAIQVSGAARVASDVDDRVASLALGRKYGFQYRAFLTVERLIRRLQRRPGERVIIRISPTSA